MPKEINDPSGEWDFNIDLDSIRAEAEAEKKQQEDEKGLMAELDALTQELNSVPDDLEPSGYEDSEATRILSSVPSPSCDPLPEDTNEQTVVIPAVPRESTSVPRGSSNVGTRRASSGNSPRRPCFPCPSFGRLRKRRSASARQNPPSG